MNNLIRQSLWYNPLTAITEKNNAYELDNIIIYSEDGALIETDRGWLDNGNNSIKDGLEIKPAIKRKTKIDYNCKDNFVIKSEQKPYKFDAKYTLYLYYKNINYKYLGLTLDNLFLNINYSILNGVFNSYMVIGDRDKESYHIKYSETLKEALEKMNTYNFSDKEQEFLKAINTIKKYHKKYQDAKKYEATLTIDNWNEIIRESSKIFLENNKKLKQ